MDIWGSTGRASRWQEQPCRGSKVAVCLSCLWNHDGGQCGLEQSGPRKELERGLRSHRGLRSWQLCSQSQDFGFYSEWKRIQERVLCQGGASSDLQFQGIPLVWSSGEASGCWDPPRRLHEGGLHLDGAVEM